MPEKYIRNCLLSGEQIAQIEVTIIKPSPQNEIPPNNRRLPLPRLLTSANKHRAWMFGQAQGTQSILQGLDRLTKHLKPIITPNHGVMTVTISKAHNISGYYTILF